MTSKYCLAPLLILAAFSTGAAAQSSENKSEPANGPGNRQEEQLPAETDQPRPLEANIAPVFLVAYRLNADVPPLKDYQRGLDYAIDYFGNDGPYYVYLLAPGYEENIRHIFRKRLVTSTFLMRTLMSCLESGDGASFGHQLAPGKQPDLLRNRRLNLIRGF
jgi:hypothetical protein